MDAKDKKPRVVKPAQPIIKRNHIWLYALGLLAVVLLAGLLIHIAFNTVASPSKKLTSKVKSLENGHHECSDGLKQIGPDAKNIAAATQYSISAREKALNYIVPCEFMTGHTEEALKYAQQLDGLYVKDGSQSASKRDQLASFVNYMKNYNQ